MSQAPPNHQPLPKKEPLFAPIEMETIEMPEPEAPAEQPVPVFSKFEVGVILTTYLFVFVGNGEITIPLLLVIPEVLMNIFQADIDIVFPCLIGVSGILMACQRLFKEPTTRGRRVVVSIGLFFLLTSLFFFWTVSANGFATFISAIPTILLYLKFYNGAPKL